MRTRMIAAMTMAGAVMLGLGGQPDKKGEHPSGGGKHQEHPAPAAKASPLDQLKALAGTWAGPTRGADGKPEHTVTYRVSSGGSAVVETLFPGTDHEMVDMYTMEGDDLVMTHYCAMGNQPHLRYKKDSAKGTMEFEFVNGGNMKSRDEAHMDSMVLTLIYTYHIKSKWTALEHGQVTETVEFDLVRQK